MLQFGERAIIKYIIANWPTVANFKSICKVIQMFIK
jgi:hypothetical protein